MRRPLLTSLALMSVLAVGQPALAGPLNAQEEANARFQTGLTYYDARDFESARLAFTQAYAVLQKPGILLNLALSELYSNRPVEALAHLEAYLKDASAPAERRERAKKATDEAFKKTGHLSVKTAGDASLTVDGKPASPAAGPPPVIHVMPGFHTVQARLGDKTKTATAEGRAGETTTVDLSFDNDGPVVATVAGGGAASPASTASPTDARFTEPPREAQHSESFWGLRSISGFVLLGLGAAGLGIAIASKGEESSQRDKADRLAAGLPAPDACTGAATANCRALADAP